MSPNSSKALRLGKRVQPVLALPMQLVQLLQGKVPQLHNVLSRGDTEYLPVQDTLTLHDMTVTIQLVHGFRLVHLVERNQR